MNIALIIVGFLFVTYIERNKQEKIPVARPEHFQNAQVLLPDYAHTDTLIVIDAQGLNAAIETLQPRTDGEISDLLYTYCKTKTESHAIRQRNSTK